MNFRIMLLVLFSLLALGCDKIDYPEEILSIPIDGSDTTLAATFYHPEGSGPFPLAVVNHGEPGGAVRRARYGYWRKPHLVNALVSRGFAVIVPMRQGFGATGGEYRSDYGGCKLERPRFYESGLRAAEDVITAMKYAQSLPSVDRNKIILVGHSAGGVASLAAASKQPEGLIAVANFSGGLGGGNPETPGIPCHADVLGDAISAYTQTIDVPVLWYYVANDRYFSPDFAHQWFASFQHNGGKGELEVAPKFGDNGHNLLLSKNGVPIWGPVFDNFLQGYVPSVSKNGPE